MSKVKWRVNDDFPKILAIHEEENYCRPPTPKEWKTGIFTPRVGVCRKARKTDIELMIKKLGGYTAEEFYHAVNTVPGREAEVKRKIRRQLRTKNGDARR